MTKHLHLKKVLAAVLTIAALATGQQAFATVSQTVTFQGMTYTQNNNSYYGLQINGIPWGNLQLPHQQGTSCQFNNAHLSWSPVFVTLNGKLQFQESTTATDVVAGGTFTVTFASQSLWFYGASVKKLDGTDVTLSNVTISNDRHTVTVAINYEGTQFGQIILDYVPNEPFNSNNTVVSGIEPLYIWNGSPITFEPPTVTYNGNVLTEGTDYTVSYPDTGTNPLWYIWDQSVTITGTGNYAGTVSQSFIYRNVNLTDFTQLNDGSYQIATQQDLDYLALYVGTISQINNSYQYNYCEGLTFKQTADIAYTYTTAWNGSGNETNFTAIGGWGRPFKGTFDGQNHSISGIRISKTGQADSDKCQGLFGIVDNGGTVRNVVLADTRIKGYTGTGGIVGTNYGTIEDCRVQNNVLIRSSGKPIAGNNGSNFGGIAGSNENGGTVTRCTSSVTIDGYVGTTIYSVCLGAIVGSNGGTLTANYYRGCTVINSDNPNGTSIGIGVGTVTGSQDQDGARSVHALTLGTDITATGESVVIDGTTYYASNTTVTLGYSGTVPAGQLPFYSVDGTAIEGNTFRMPTADCMVSVTLASAWSGSGTQGAPYVITTTAQLDALAAAVKGGEAYSGTYFVLGNDIAYSTEGLGDTDENFIPIGGYFDGSDKNFSGTFDGQGHTISGIRLYKSGTDDQCKYQGLFGRIYFATVKNVILTDARITGRPYVGGIVGSNSGTVSNCLVLNSVVTGTSYAAAIVGSNASTITANYYRGCTVTNNNHSNGSSIEVGVGLNTGSHDKKGARSVHTLTLGENITATGECVAYQGTTYYASNTNITLGYNNLPAGYTVTYTLNGTALTGNTFTMPANDNAVVSATVTAPTYTKAITAYHTENGVNYGWYLIASPIGTVNLTDVPHLFDNQYDLYYFDQTGGNNGKEWKNHKAHTNTFTTLESGIGYLYANSGNVTLEFTGAPYSGNGQVTLSYSTASTTSNDMRGWNLIGNPFSTAATLDKPFYRMNESGTALSAQVEAHNSVAAMEGVFVQASTNNETATFTQANNSKGGEKDAVPMLTLNLTRNRGEAIDNAIVRFDGGQALGKFTLHKDGSKLYIPQGGKDYAIACAEGQGEMPLNFKAEEDGTYTLTVNVEGLEMGYLHLIDNMTGVDIDLLHPNAVIAGEDPQSLVPLYTFQAKTTDYESRFKLVFASVCEDADDDNETFAYISNGNIIVNGEGTLQIFDALGRQVMRKQLSTVYAQLSTANFPAGVYMIRLINGENVRTQKVVVK